MIYIAYAILAILAFLALVVIARAATFKPKNTQVKNISSPKVDIDHATESLRQMIRCKTISSAHDVNANAEEFEKFRQLLARRYPNITAKCSLQRFDNSGILYHWKGEKSAKPTVLMSHYDVVPVEQGLWSKPAFDAILEDGVIWGRGTLDTKGTLCGVMEAVEQYIESGFIPKNDIYLAFSGDEEVAGNGQPSIVEYFEQQGIKPALVVDEGGAVVENVFPGVSQPAALIGLGEKGMLNIELKVKSKGGHASSPPRHTPVGVLAQAVQKIENNPFTTQLTKPAAEMFDTLGRYSSFGYKILFANLWFFRPVLDLICTMRGGELNALMRTTCAFTCMQGSSAYNVLPPVASVAANLRLIGTDTVDSVKTRLEKLANNSDIEFTVISGNNPSVCSKTEGEAWDIVKNSVASTWPEAIVSPYLMVACSDSRHYGKISDCVYRFSAMALTKEERGEIHGHDERVPITKLEKVVEFYLKLIAQC